jgi:5-deoxy-D-glucuronate isomerase
MSAYPWSRQAPLPTLHASGQGDTLLFRAGDETATVKFNGQHIESVHYKDASSDLLITAAESKMITVGSENYQRDVYHFLYPSGPAPTMRLGLTVHRGEGTWSSLPHDFELHTEPDFEEVFFYLLKGGSERAVQVGRGVWSDNAAVDDCWQIKDKSFSAVPMGYHPVGAEPHVSVAYVWAYLCKQPHWEKVDF